MLYGSWSNRTQHDTNLFYGLLNLLMNTPNPLVAVGIVSLVSAVFAQGVIQAAPVPNLLALTGTVSAGTTFDAKLQADLSSAKNHDGDRFTLKEQNPLFGGNSLLKGSIIEGHLENVSKAVRGQKAGLHVVFDDILLSDGTREPIDATLVNTKLETKTQGHLLRNTAAIVGGAVAGRYLGKKTGVGHGGALGAAAAAGYVFTSPGGEIVLHRGTDFKIKLNSALNP